MADRSHDHLTTSPSGLHDARRQWRPTVRSGHVEHVAIGIHAEFLVESTHATDHAGVPYLAEFQAEGLGRGFHYHALVAVLQAARTMMTACDHEGTFLGYGQTAHSSCAPDAWVPGAT